MWFNILILFSISVFLNLLMYLIAFSFKTDKLTDISYSISFLLLGIINFVYFSSQDVMDIILLVLLNLWAIRLGTYLFVRINTMGHDHRFDNIRNNWKSFLGFWIMQGISVSIIMLSILFASSVTGKSFGWIEIIGVLIAFSGFSIEAIADQQKFLFKMQNPNKFAQLGLWKNIRHPNYLGEILIWIGISIAVIRFSGVGSWWIPFISPLWIIFLLVKFSGIPPLEKSWKERYKDNPEFQEYYENSWRLIPGLY